MDAEQRPGRAPRAPAQPGLEGTDAGIAADPQSVSAVFLFQVDARPDGSLAARGLATNDAARSLTAIDDAASAPVPLDGLFSPASAIDVLSHLKRVVETGAAHRCAIRIAAHGVEVSGETSFTPIHDADGAITNIVMVAPPAGGLGSSGREQHVARGSGTIGAFRSERGLGNVFVSPELAEMLGIPPKRHSGRAGCRRFTPTTVVRWRRPSSRRSSTG